MTSSVSFFHLFSLQSKSNKISILKLVFLILLDISTSLLCLALIGLFLQETIPSSTNNYGLLEVCRSYLDSFFDLLGLDVFALTLPSFLILVVIVNMLIRLLSESLISSLSNSCASFIVSQYFFYYLNLPYSSSSSIPSNIINSRCITSAFLLGDTYISVFQSFYSVVFIAIVSLFLLFVVPISVYLLLIFPVILASLLLLVFRNAMKFIGKKENSYSIQLAKVINDAVGSLKEIILFDLASKFNNIHFSVDSLYRQAHSKTVFFASSPKYIIEAFVTVLLPSIGIYCYFSNSSFTSLIPTLGLLLVATQKMAPQLQIIFRTWSVFTANIQSIYPLLVDVKSYDSKSFDFLTSHQLTSIGLDNVSFAFTGSKYNVINACCLKLQAGKSYGIIGETGSGKSTLSNLLMGLLSPSTGSISLRFANGSVVDVTRNARQLLQSSSLVSQETFVFADSFIYNICLDKDSFDMSRIIKVCKIACIHDFITSLPSGYDTLLGERGSSLSGGQKQRLGIARALYFQRPLLVLDEPTSALDTQTESLLLDNIFSEFPACIIIMITHNVDALSYVDHTIKLDNGTVSIL